MNRLRGNWNTKDLEEAMDVIERGFTSLRKASQYWNIPLTSLSDHSPTRLHKKNVAHLES
jgi:hypothetical protein